MFSTSPGWQGLPVKPASERGKDKDRPHWWGTSRVNSGWKQGLAGWPWVQQFTNLLLQFLPLQDKVRINGGLCHLWSIILLETAPSWNRVSPVRSVTYTSYKKEWNDKAKKKKKERRRRGSKGQGPLCSSEAAVMMYILANEAWEHLSCPFIHSTNMYWRPALCQTLNEALGIQCRMRQTSSSLQCAGGLVGEERHWAMIIKYDVPVWVGECGILQGHARKIWLGLSYGVRVFPDCHLRHEGREEVGTHGLSFVPTFPFFV